MLDEVCWRRRCVKFMIGDRGSNFTTAFDAVLADAGILTALCNVRKPRMNVRRQARASGRISEYRLVA